MAKNTSNSKSHVFMSLLAVGVLVFAVFVSTSLTKQKQSTRTKAANQDPLLSMAESECTCTGSTACTKITDPVRCQSNKKCLWTCSDESFPKPRLITPNGGEEWKRTKTYQVTWEQTEAAYSTGLFIYTRDKNVDTYHGAIAYYVSNQVGINTYDWTIPLTGGPASTSPDGSNIILAVAQFDSDGLLLTYDKSDAIFTIETPAPTLVSPNGREVFERGNTYDISWIQEFASPFATGLFIYTRKGNVDTYIGAIEYYVSNNVGANTYSWTVPPEDGPWSTPPDGSNIIVEVAQYRDAETRLTSDKSDRSFTITTP